MAIVFGINKFSNQNPNGNSQTLGVTCSNGTDKGLFVVVTMANSTNFSSATYNGVSMLLIDNNQYPTASQRQCAFWLANPDSGTQYNLIINFTGSQFNNTSIMAQSFTGVSQATITNFASSGLQNTPNIQNITINANDIIYLSGISGDAQSFDYQIAGITVTNLFAHNTNRQVEGAFSTIGLSAGLTEVRTIANSNTITNHRWAISQSQSISRRKIIIV